MSIGLLGSLLARLFRRPATSVSPKTGLRSATIAAAFGAEIEPDREPITDPNDISGPTHPLDEIGNLILKQLRESGMIPAGAEVSVHHQRIEDTPGWHDRRQADRPGIKPPPDAGTDGWTWSRWNKEAAAGGQIPGWAFCRFANRLGQEQVGFVFGHVRGSFGVWQQPFDVCTGDDEGIEQRQEVLTCVTHLRTGMGVGIFIDRDTAIVAAELAEKVTPGWEDDGPSLPAMWRGENWSRTLTAWHGIGITEATNAHAHDRHGTRFPIFGQSTESVMAGKPERLS